MATVLVICLVQQEEDCVREAKNSNKAIQVEFADSTYEFLGSYSEVSIVMITVDSFMIYGLTDLRQPRNL